MPRVLHLSDVLADFSAGHAAASLVQHAVDEFRIESRTIGRGGDYRNPATAVFAMRGEVAGAFDVVHVFSFAALWVALFAGAGRIIFSPVQLLPRRSIRWLAAAMKRRDIRLVCTSETEQRIDVQHGIDPRRCTLIPPGVAVEPAHSRRDPALRQALGLADEDYVLLAPGETTRQAGHREALWATGLLHVLDPRYRLLIWGRGAKVQSCANLAGKLNQARALVMAEQTLGRKIEFAGLLPAADAVLFAPGGPTPVLPLALCMGAGLPIVATRAPGFGNLLKDGDNCMLAPQRSSRMLAQRVVEMRQNAELQTRIRESARNQARDLFCVRRFIEQYNDIYRKIAENPS
jgi:glycosyltransferase involved in cell wall biosynthesis